MEIYQKTLEKMTKLYKSKNSDYGDSVSDTYQRFGIDAFLVRMYDKLNRLYSLTREKSVSEVKDEKIEDTLIDLANYAILSIIELECEKDSLTKSAEETKVEVLLEKCKMSEEDYPYTIGGELGVGVRNKEIR